MKLQFNANCAGCRALKPRCVRVRLKRGERSYGKDIIALCGDCRSGPYRGRYRLEDGGHR